MLEWKGKSMTLSEWTREPECVVSETTLRQRIAKGWDMEAAMLTKISDPARYANMKRPNCEYIEYSAFGESKPLYQWYDDPRCKVPKVTLAERVKRGYSMEDALRTKLFGLKSNKVLPRYRALGNLKTLPEWSHDPRCKVSLQDLRSRMRKGWKIVAAITTPPHDFDIMSESRGRFITAFGETKTPGQWARDPRCTVTAPTLNERIEMGMNPELAITAKPREANRKESGTRQLGQPREAFGETKTLRDWCADSRCVVTQVQVLDRLRYGWELERALMTPKLSRAECIAARVQENAKFITAFGETKSVSAWARDPRSTVCRETIGNRIRKGLAPEEAITAELTGHLAKGKTAA